MQQQCILLIWLKRECKIKERVHLLVNLCTKTALIVLKKLVLVVESYKTEFHLQYRKNIFYILLYNR